MQDSYRDSKEWQSKALELGVIGAIGTGVGATILRGNASSATRGAANTAKRLAKNVDRYLDKTVFKKNPMGKFVYRTLKNVPKKSDLIQRETSDIVDDLKYDMKAIQRQTQQAKQNAALKELAQSYLEGRPAVDVNQLFNEKAHIIQLKSEAGDQWRRGLKSDLLAGNKPASKPLPQPEKKNLMSEAIGASVTGLAFGAGLTGFHALDRKLLGEDKKKERSYGAAGSYLGGKTMEKKAASGATEAYKNIATFGNKIPLAIANGIGFTGVTIGTASLLEKVRAEARQKAGGEPMQPQVVIVENTSGKKGKKNKTLEQAHFLSSSHPANYMMQQNAGQTDEYLEKTSGVRDIGARLQETFSGIPQKVQDFAKDFQGHTEERRRLLDRIEGRSISYENEAARIATPGDIADAAKDYEKFYSPEKAKELSLAHLARNMKMQDQAAHDALYEQMASARLKGLGVASTGAGLAFLARPKKEDQQP